VSVGGGAWGAGVSAFLGGYGCGGSVGKGV
jgi:hypothetical protein